MFLQIAGAAAQTPGPQSPLDSPPPGADDAARLDELAHRIVERMTPEERIGQLFVVTLHGDDAQFDSEIVDLLHQNHIGGVVLSPRNENFSNERGVDTPRQVATLTNQLQAAAYGVLLPEENALQPVQLAPWPPRGIFTYLPDVTNVRPSNLPLLIGVNQTGDDLPATSLRRGFTPLPSPMALGASWNRDQVKMVGDVVGRELRAVGFNLLLGPMLDVFSPTGTDRVGALGIYSFGADPYWVSQLGRAYIEGVHSGGNGRVATVAGNFPGQGGADRIPSEEVATIQSSQVELRQEALPPFQAVTRQPSTVISPNGDPGATDVLMTSHMRYTGLQGGDGRVRPLSLAPELRTILRQEGFEEWRSEGGVVMSGPLGAQALRRYFETSNPENFRRVAQDAFVAGNDLLFLADFGLDDDPTTHLANIKDTVQAFRTLYVQDPDFAGLVDDAARRIVRLKLGLYRDAIDPTAWAAIDQSGMSDAPVIPLSNVLVSDTDVSLLASEERVASEQEMGQIARSAITLLYPDPSTQTAPVPPPFNANDKILVFTDFRLQRECPTCEQEPSVGPDELATIIERLYGSQSSGVIDPDNVVSKTFVELTALLDSLDQPEPTPTIPVQPPITATGAITLVLPTPTPQLTPLPASSPPTSTSIGASAPITVSINVGSPAPSPSGEVENANAAGIDDVNSRTLAAIEDADWIVFAMLDVAPVTDPVSAAVKRLLSDHSDLLTDQKTVVLALQAPYYLDATEMSKLTAYFGVYSKTDPFLESAVHALFRRYPPIGAPPVDVPGTRFSSLNDRLQPDAASQIALAVETGSGEVIAQNLGEPASDGQPSIAAGSLMRLRSGPILDLNGHPVPDGTMVGFDVRYEGEDVALTIAPAATRNGVAVREVTPERGGILRIAARAGDASSGDGLGVVVIPPLVPAAEPGSAVTVTSSTAVGEELENGALGRRSAPDRVNLLTLSIALFTMAIVLSLLIIVQIRVLPRPTLVHNMLWATIFGLAGYVLYGIGLFPGGTWLRENTGVLGIPVTVLIPMLLPLLWLQLRGEDRDSS